MRQNARTIGSIPWVRGEIADTNSSCGKYSGTQKSASVTLGHLVHSSSSFSICLLKSTDQEKRYICCLGWKVTEYFIDYKEKCPYC